MRSALIFVKCRITERIWSKYVAANEYLSLCSGSYICRAAVIGNRCGMFASKKIGIAASATGVPMLPTDTKTLSLRACFCAASTAFFGS